MPDDPRQAPLRRRHAGADGRLRRRRRDVRAAEQGPHHDAPEHPDPPRPAARHADAAARHQQRSASPAARAAATPCATSPATPAPASSSGEVFDPTPYVGAYVRYFVRNPTTQLMPRKFKIAFTGSDEDRAITGIHDIAFLAAQRDGVKGFEVRVGGGTSIMPRVAPTLYDFVEVDNGDYLKVSEAVLRIFDRQDELRVNRARARIKVLIDKIGIDAFREQVERGAARATGSPSATSTPSWSSGCSSTTRGGRTLPTRRPPPPRPTATAPSSTASCRPTSTPQRQEGFIAVAVKITRGDLTPGAVPRPGDDHARVHRRLRAHAPCSRTWSCAGCATRRSTRSGRSSRGSASARPAPTRSPTW